MATLTSPWDKIAKSVISPNPASSSLSRPCKTIATSVPNWFKAWAIIGSILGSKTPIICPVGYRGFTNGPNKLNTVRTFRV